jgi:heme exporter protein A
MSDEQRRVAFFQAQPGGPPLFSRPAALSLAYVASLHGTRSALPDEKTGAVSLIQIVLTGPDMPATALLQAQNLACERGGRRLFVDISFVLEPGALLQVDGPNGSGKTSLLRILCGLLRMDSGTVCWQGVSIDEQRSDYLQQIHYSGHLHGVKPELSPAENLRFARALHGGEPWQDIQTALDRVALYGFEDEPAGTLSAGQRRRIGLARLLVSKARLWVLDEPFTTLDTSGAGILEELIETHLNNGGCAVMASHTRHGLDHNRVQTLRLTA